MTKDKIKSAFGTAYLSESRIDEMEKQLLSRFGEGGAVPLGGEGEHGRSYRAEAKKRGFAPVILGLSAAAVVALCVGGCAWLLRDKPPVSSDGSDINDIPVSTVTAEAPPRPETEEIIPPQQGYYDNVYEEISEDLYSGPRSDYEQWINIITDPRNGGLSSLYLVETVKALTAEECTKLYGFSEWYGSETLEASDSGYINSDDIIYEVRIIRDLISGEKQDGVMYISLRNGDPAGQNEGDPCYSPHERFTIATYQCTDNNDIIRTCGFRYDVAEENGVWMAYSRGRNYHTNFTLDELHISGSEDINEKIIRSTTQNPAIYTQKMPLDTLAEFLRTDWKRRGIGMHYEIGINDAALSDLGMTFKQLCDKYGEPVGSHSNTRVFEGGLGRYSWKSYVDGVSHSDDLSGAGGCNCIDGIGMDELFSGLSFPLTRAEFAEKTGFILGYSDTEPSMDDMFWTSYTHPQYGAVLLSIAAKQQDVIDEAASMVLQLDVDCTLAKPLSQYPAINSDILSDLGLTINQLYNKYGTPISLGMSSEGSNAVQFSGCVGTYSWFSEDGIFYDDLTDAGGCNLIYGIAAEDAFINLDFPLNLNDLAKLLGLTVNGIDSDRTKNGFYWASFGSEANEKLTIMIGTSEHMRLDSASQVMFRLETDFPPTEITTE